MAVQTIFDLCTPRQDVLEGVSSDSDFAADLSHVVRGSGGPAEYRESVRFFANTYPTRGLKAFLANVCARLSGGNGSVAAIFRLDTSFGGGKTHGLIALVHAANGMKGVVDPAEYLDPALIPSAKVRIATFDGENADPANGRRMGDDVLAYTPWGEIAYALAGRGGYERMRRSDEQGMAPGAETIAELFGDQPVLILLDELSLYFRKIKGKPNARDQMTAFLTSLFKAVESSPHAALVYTLAIGKDGKTGEAYSDENQFVADRMAEAESVSARKATLLNPTEDDETIQVLRRRLFARIDEAAAAQVIEGDQHSYKALWHRNCEALAPEAAAAETLATFRNSYPFHPDVLATFTGKTATLANFQRVRGMLRILGRTVGQLWQTRPSDATAIHLHHIDVGYEPIRQEIITRLGQGIYLPALRNDIAGEPGKRSLAQEIDDANHRGMPPYATYVARTVFMHTLAFNEQLKGLTPEHLRYAMIGPQVDISFVEAARQKFIAESAYLDDRPGVPLRFLAEANLTQIIRRCEQNIDAGDVRTELNACIIKIFKNAVLELVPFPGGPQDVPDEVGDGRPLLVLPSYDACSVGIIVDAIPDLIARIYERKGAEGGSLRALRNNLVFIVAEEGRADDMRRQVTRRLALQKLKASPQFAELADHQQDKVREYEARSESDVALAIQHCYRHLFYSSNNRMPGAVIDLAHTALDTHSASEKPGCGQQQVVSALRQLNKLRLAEDEPDSPTYIRDRTPLRRGQVITSVLRDEFRRDPTLPMLIGDDIFVRGIRAGIEKSEFIYRRETLLYGPGDPLTTIAIDEQAVVFTMSYAVEHDIWPRSRTQAIRAAAFEADHDVIYGIKVLPDDGNVVGSLLSTPMTALLPAIHVLGRGNPAGVAVSAGSVKLSAEGVLREALIRLWEQARSAKVARIGLVSIRMFDAADAFRLLGVIASVKGADQKKASITCEYETTSGSAVSISFEGTPQDAQPLREFLDPQLRAAKDKHVTARFTLSFADGLPLEGEAVDKLTEQLTRLATGAAYVEATAEAKS